MTDTEVSELIALDEAVAERIMGIKPRNVRVRGSTDEVMVYTTNPACSDGQWTTTELLRYFQPPSYSMDANEVRKVEAVIVRRDSRTQAVYAEALLEQVGAQATAMLLAGWYRHVIAVAHATPAQRCRAALKAVEGGPGDV